MPRKKKTETTPAHTKVKAEVVTETVKEAPAPVEVKEAAPAAEAPSKEEKPVKKPTTRKTAAKKTTKTATKATAKTTTKASAPKETVKVQFGADEYDFAEIKKAVEADYKTKFKGKVKSIEFYIKPEDKAVYYVINSDFSDKIDL